MPEALGNPVKETKFSSKYVVIQGNYVPGSRQPTSYDSGVYQLQTNLSQSSQISSLSMSFVLRLANCDLESAVAGRSMKYH